MLKRKTSIHSMSLKETCPTRTAIRSHLSQACRRPEVTKNVGSFGLKQTAVVNPWTYQTESHENHKEQEDYPED